TGGDDGGGLHAELIAHQAFDVNFHAGICRHILGELVELCVVLGDIELPDQDCQLRTLERVLRNRRAGERYGRAGGDDAAARQQRGLAHRCVSNLVPSGIRGTIVISTASSRRYAPVGSPCNARAGGGGFLDPGRAQPNTLAYWPKYACSSRCGRSRSV